jgi:hypothetical protein
VSGDPVLSALGDIQKRLGNVEGALTAVKGEVAEVKVVGEATHDQAVKTNGRVTALEAAEIRRAAIESERIRAATAATEQAAEVRRERTFKERWQDRLVPVAGSLIAVALGYLIGH